MKPSSRRHRGTRDSEAVDSGIRNTEFTEDTPQLPVETHGTKPVTRRRASSVLALSLNSKLALSSVLIVTLALATLGLRSGSGFGSHAPGPTFELKPAGSASAAPIQGTWLATTVEINEVSVWESIRLRILGGTLVPLPTSTSSWTAKQDMASSLSNALAAATAAIGGVKAEVALVIGAVDESSLGYKVGMRSGEYIHSINGETVTDLDEASRILGRTSRSVSMVVGEPSRTLSIPVRSGALGVQILTMPTSKLPDLKVELPGVGGPSAGLLVALSEVDALTPGDLTGGRIIAGTGVIEIDGRVRPVSGAEAKIQAALQAKASIFFAPTDQEKSETTGMKVVPVETLRAALEYLCSNGSPAACPIVGR